jgi:hypothetical protein
MDKFWIIAALLGAIVLTTALTVFIHCGNLPRPQKNTLYVLQAAILAAQTGQFLTVVSTPAEMDLFIKIQSIALCLASSSFFFYCHTAVLKRYPGTWRVLSMGWVPFLGTGMILSNSAHHLFYTVYEPVPFNFKFNSGYAFIALCNYVLVLIGLALIYFSQRRKGHPNRKLAGTGIIAMLFVALLDGWEQMTSFGIYDLTPVSFAAFQAAILIGNRGAIGYKAVLSNRLQALDCINESIVITDHQNTVLYSNRAQLNNLLNIGENRDLAEIIAAANMSRGCQENPIGQEAAYASNRETCSGSVVFTFPELPAPMHCSYYIQPIGKDGDGSGGMLHVFRDVSEYKVLIDQLEQKQKELMALTDRLQKYAGVVRQLAEERERQRIVRHVNSVIGYSIKQIACNLESLESLREGETVLMKERIRESIDNASQAIKRIRESIAPLAARDPLTTNRKGGGAGWSGS